MTDYRHDLLFGLVLTPDATRPADVLELARLADQLGLDLVSVADHPYRPAFLDAMTVLTSIAAHTSRVHVFPNVANLPLRPPAGLARAVASLDVLSGGRAELGLGAGGYWDEIAGDGGTRRSPKESVDALAEALHVVRALWAQGPPVDYDGDHYRLHQAQPEPPTPHDIAIWVGAIKPRMLRLIGRAADGWLPSATRVPPAELAPANQLIDDAAYAAGRQPDDVRRLYNVPGTFSPGAGFLNGPASQWAEQLADVTLTAGISAYLLPTDDADTIRRFACEVVPDARRRVIEGRR